jgi:hypothetical protein
MYVVIRTIAYLGLSNQLLAIPLFLALGVPAMAWVNVGSSLAWALGVFANERGRRPIAVLLFTGEVVVHSAAAVYFVGFDAGFQLYLMGAVPFAVYNQGVRDRALVLENGRTVPGVRAALLAWESRWCCCAGRGYPTRSVRDELRSHLRSDRNTLFLLSQGIAGRGAAHRAAGLDGRTHPVAQPTRCASSTVP